MSNPADRFWAKVSKSAGCWVWTGAKSATGHALIFWDGRSRPASHVALLLDGRSRKPGTEACHRCDNPPCVNPSHLYWGTRQDNVNDAYARGRRAGGERHAAARLSEADVIDIRLRFANGTSRDVLANEYKVAPKTINDIASGRKWPFAPGPITRRIKIKEKK